MRIILLKLLLFIVFLCGQGYITHAQHVSSYIFSSSLGEYASVSDDTTQLIAGNSDSGISSVQDIGFVFNFAGVNYTTFSATANGWIVLGSHTVSNNITPLTSSGLRNLPVISFFGRDGRTGPNGVVYNVSGVSPNKILTIQYENYKPVSSNFTITLSVQVKLYESTNTIEFVYGPSRGGAVTTGQVGLSYDGDFNTRLTTTDWSFTSAGTSAGSTLSLSTTVYPRNGLTYRWDRPSCIAPTNLNSVGATQNSATLSWDAATVVPEGGYEFFYSTSDVPPLPATVGDRLNDTVVNLTGLAAETQYYAWVRSLCSDTNKSAWSTLKSFRTDYCRFTGVTSSNLQNITTTTAVSNISYSSASTSMYIDNSSQSIVSYPGQSISVTLRANLSNHYYYAWVDWNNNFDLNDEGENVIATTLLTSQFSGTFVVPEDLPLGEYRIRFASSRNIITNPCMGLTWGSYVDYTLRIQNVPSCSTPISLSIDHLSSSASAISWAIPDVLPENGYEYYYSTSNTVPTTSTIPLGICQTEHVVIESLEANSSYYFWVRAVCSDADKSFWSSVLTFHTPCNSVDVPYLEDFESAVLPNLPNCTSDDYFGTGSRWLTSNRESYSNYGFRTNALVYTYHLTEPANTWFYTKGINLIAGEVYRISYRYGRNSSVYGEKLKVAYGTSPIESAMTTILQDHDSITVVRATPTFVDFSPTTSGIFYFGFHAYSPADFYTLLIDDIIIDYLPTCFAPDMVIASDVTLNSATLSWDVPRVDPSAGYEYFYATSDTLLTEQTVGILTTLRSVALTDLLSDVVYYVWVRSICSDTDQSSWSLVTTFRTGYCIPVNGNSFYLKRIETTNAISDISFNNQTNQAYVNNSSQSIVSFPGHALTLSLASNQVNRTFYYHVWVDWNQDLDFSDAGEHVVALTVPQTSFTGTISIPDDLPVGDYRIRFGQSIVDNMSECEILSSSSYVDYNLKIVDDVCSSPIVLSGGGVSRCNNSPLENLIVTFPTDGEWTFTYSNAVTTETLTTTERVFTFSPPTAGTFRILSSEGECSALREGIAVVSIARPIWTSSIQTICAGESLTVGTNTYSASGRYEDVLTSVNGCDSLVITELVILAELRRIQNITICHGDIYSVGNNHYSESGVYEDVLISLNGCDSTVITHLTVLEQIAFTQRITVCIGQEITVGNSVYRLPGTYVDVLTSVMGCDSIVTTVLNPIVLIAEAEDDGVDFVAPLIEGATYQWYNCANNELVATTPRLPSTQNGFYRVRISLGYCSRLSDCYHVYWASVGVLQASAVEVYPNPTTATVTIKTDQTKIDKVEVLDVNGRIIQTHFFNNETPVVSLEEYNSGVYLFNIYSNDSHIVKRITKQ